MLCGRSRHSGLVVCHYLDSHRHGLSPPPLSLIPDPQAVKKSSHVLRKLAKRKASLEQGLEEQFSSGRLLAAITSRPGQSGRADGYVSCLIISMTRALQHISL